MSISHLLIIFFILLLVFGPSRLEGLGTSLGKAIKGFKKGLDEGSADATATTTTATTTVTTKPTESQNTGTSNPNQTSV